MAPHRHKTLRYIEKSSSKSILIKFNTFLFEKIKRKENENSFLYRVTNFNITLSALLYEQNKHKSGIVDTISVYIVLNYLSYVQ